MSAITDKAPDRDEDAVQQNKRIKEAEFAEDSREPNAQEVEAIRKEVRAERAVKKIGAQNAT
ncbi:hypothetical protein MMC10_009793 [Thelotrema lepadinum]|nr:hypothetical protein [Thelotrema lepadinum]